MHVFLQVHGVAFSPSGEKLAMVTHGSMISVGVGGEDALVQVRTEHLPFNDCLWITENSLVAAVSMDYTNKRMYLWQHP